MKYILVSGGVISGIGKGIFASSLGLLLKTSGLRVTAIKIDPSSEEAVTTLAMLYTDEGDTAHALKVLSSIPDSARSAKLYSALGAAYEQRKSTVVTHPVYGYRMSYSRMLEVQARMLAAYVRGSIPAYTGFTVR